LVCYRNLATTLTKTIKSELDSGELTALRDDLVEEKRRLERLLQRVEDRLGKAQPTAASPSVRFNGAGTKEVAAPRSGPLDSVKT